MAEKPGVPESWHDPGEHVRKVAQVVNQLQRGQTNAAFKVTLGAGTTTEVIRPRATPEMHAQLSPITAAAAADFAAGTTYAVVESGKVVIHHAAGGAGREYGVLLQG